MATAPTSTKKGGLAVAIKFTPQAQADNLTLHEDQLNDGSQSLTGADDASENILANDGGGAAARIMAVISGDAVAAVQSNLTEYVDLANNSASKPAYMSAAIAHGTVTLDASGNVTFTTAENINYLAAGETLDLGTFTYIIRMANGAFSVTTAHVNVAGDNDAVTITSAPESAIVVEDTATAASNTIAFTDPDLSDTHSAGFAAAGTNTTALGTFSMDAVSEVANAANGTVTWHYNLNNAAAQYLGQGESVVEKYTVTVDDLHGSTTQQDVTITIQGVNDAAVIAGDPSGLIHEDNGVAGAEGTIETTTGSLSFTDADVNDTHAATAGGATHGTGSVTGVTDTVNGTGGQINWSYSVNDSAINYLGQGEHIQDTFTIHLTETHPDSSTSTVDQVVTVDIYGTNDDALIANSGNTGAVTEDANSGGPGVETASGTLSFSDVDLIDTHTATVVSGGTHYGTLTLDPITADTTGTGTGGQIGWHYTVNDNVIDSLNTGDTPTDTFTIDLFDGTSHVLHNVTITINGVTEPPATPTVASPYTGTGDPNDFDNLGLAGDQNPSDFSGATRYGGPGNDHINGAPANTGINLYGGTGDDDIVGNNAANSIYGGSGSDTIKGNGGADLIVGGYGADTLTGNGGNDTFQFLSTRDTGDTVTDFTAGTGGDVFDFSRIDSTNGSYDPLPDNGSPAFGLYADSNVHAHSINYFQSGADTIIWADTDGDTSTVELEVTVQNVQAANLVSGNFIL
jgi:VCBS repeat-containing protein